MTMTGQLPQVQMTDLSVACLTVQLWGHITLIT